MKFKHLLFTLLITLLSFPSIEAQTVKRGPYIQLGTTSSTIVRWRTDVSTQSKVWFGTNANDLSQMASSSGTTKEHEVLVSGLSPATKYYYRIGDNGGPYAELHGTQYFKTHPEEDGIDQPIRAWMLGNAGTGDPEQEQVRDAYYNVIGNEHIDMILFTGDNAYDDGKDSEYQELVFEMYEERLANSIAWSCFGNHDGGDADSDDESGTYYEVFNFPRDGQSGGVASGTEAYYSFDYGNMHVISLNTQDVPREDGDDMIVWLEEDMAANEKKWIVTILHHRPYTGSNDNDSDDDIKPTDVREFMLPLLEAGGCDLVLSSHSHNYQRSFLINGHYGKSNTFDEDEHGIDMGDGKADGDGVYSKVNSNIGTVYVVAGTAGQDDTSIDELQHPVMHYNSGSPGSVQLLVSDDELVYQFINENEEVEDYFTIVKTPSIPVSGFQITNPTEGETFAPQQNITITADTTGTLINVDHVDFYVNNVLIGSDNSAPFTQVWVVPGSADYQIKAIASDASGNNTEQGVVNVSSGAQESCSSISSGLDDAEEKESGSIKLTSNDLELIEDGGLQHVGLRFANAAIPFGVFVDSAFIQFTVDETNNVNPCVLQIHGEKSLNPVNYDGEDFNISTRTKTNVNVSWSPEDWLNVDAAGAAQRTPNIASVIQELISQPGYDDSQALAFIVDGIGKRVAASYDNGANLAPTLCVYYTPSYCPDLQVTIGTSCNDNNPNTYDDLITANCECAGVTYGCPTLQMDIGDSCNDNNGGTYDDVVTANCVCAGTPYDCPTLQTDIGTPCDDNNSGTYDDVVTANCVCAGTPYDCPTLQTDIGTPCNDNNNGTYDDVVTANCVCAGTAYDCATLQADFGDECDDNNPLTGNDQVTVNCNCEGSLVEGEITIEVTINHEDDDAEEQEDGHVSLGSSDLELVEDGNVQVIGIRFGSVDVPEGVTILDAYLRFTTDETGAVDPCILNISGEAANTPQTFSSDDFSISNRARTNASVSWEPEPWITIGDNGVAQKSSNITSIIQELINRPGYTSGNAMAFIIEGQGKRVAESYDGDPEKAPKLYVTFISSCDADDDDDGVCNDQDLCNGPEPGTPCNDNNNGTYGDVINDNCNCVGTSFDCPVLAANVGDTCDDGNPTTFNDTVNGSCNCEGSDVVFVETVCSQIANDEDDAEERADGSVRNSSSDLELMEDGDLQEQIGLRFLNLDIPQGAIIQEASVQFMADKISDLDPCELVVFAEAADDPPSFDESDFNISDRIRTTATVAWSPPFWTEKGATGPAERTADISSVLQEVVNRSGFSESSAVVIMLEGIGKRVAESFEGGEDRAPVLCVTYSTSSTSPLGMMGNTDGASSLQVDRSVSESGSDLISENNDLVAFSELKVFPNPAKDQLNLIFSSLVEIETEVRIEHMNGKLLNVENYQTKAGKNHIKITNLNLSNGVYLVKVREEGGWQTKKFVVLK